MKLLLNQKNFFLMMGIVLCYAHTFFGKSKKVSMHDQRSTQELSTVHNNTQQESIVQKDPDLFKSPLVKEYLSLARSYHQEHNYEKAIEFYTKTLLLDESNFDALKGIAAIAFMQKEFSLAIKYYQTLITHYPRCVSAHYNLGLCYLQSKQYSDASKELKKSTSLNCDHHKAWYALGTSLEAENDSTQAFKAYEKALTLDPTFATAHFRLGLLHKNNNHVHEAITHLQQALSLDKNNHYIMMELANLFNTINEHEKALNLYVTILKTDPLNSVALYNCGFTLKKQNRISEALAIYEKIIEIDPSYAKAHCARAHILLSLGNFIEGFKEYEWRFTAYDQIISPYAYPLWDGSDLSGKTLLVRAEQSIDDTIQFARYVPLLQKENTRIIFQVQNSLKQLFQCSEHFHQVIDYTQNPPDCDFQIPLMSIPFLLKTTLHTIPYAAMYLNADEHLVAYWKSYLAHDSNVKIGVYWNDTRYDNNSDTQSIPPSIFTQLAKIPHVTLYSLHRFDQQIPSCPKSIQSFGAHFDTIHGPFMDSAAVIKNLDLVISIDAAMGHLAAALGAATWIILPEHADWRWLIDRCDSPWYLNVRLFRQTSNDWTSVTSSLLHNISLLAQKKKDLRDSARCNVLETQPLDNNDESFSILSYHNTQDDSFFLELQRSMLKIIDQK